ncbi:class I SAM-dependent methyltransferase [Streptomyces sp. P9(2023)]|uniref:class I SAM-dependent methyltransferase n=1 Tax=Streptomyces sp. P9(2023) TaxID=3064394 RepID=UPI0028F3E5F2|nr:class I SAM-dependent methyltransferase [Streptomyces sp. P9(2023)]MDT9691350.1 class I SAM-dependent methyltransferase [Streptomyces sp. P9(2023)]
MTQDHDHDHDHSAGHGHHHHHATHLDWAAMAPLLERQAELHSPLYTRAADWLGELVPAVAVRRILDVGSGPGVITALLAEAFPLAEAVAVDATPELLERARERAEVKGLADRVTTLRAELPADFDALGEADLIWAGNSTHHIGDQRSALASFAGLLRPGGLIALVEGGLYARHLPANIGFGRPGLETRIEAVHADWFAQMRAELPDAKDEVDDWRALLAAAGLTPSGTRSFLTDIPAPVPAAVRDRIVAHFTRLREPLDERLDAEDRASFDRLLDPADPLSVHRRTDLFMLSASTVHTARKG